MRRMFIFGMVVALSLVLVVSALAGASNKLSLKVGEEIFACNCGEKCDCQTMSRKEANCACNKPMVKAKVVKMEGAIAQLQAPGWQKPLPFNTVGKYMCACGPECKCDTISQKPGKCACNKEMKKAS